VQARDCYSYPFHLGSTLEVYIALQTWETNRVDSTAETYPSVNACSTDTATTFSGLSMFIFVASTSSKRSVIVSEAAVLGSIYRLDHGNKQMAQMSYR
jgi:hypothetical protein